MSKSQVRHIHDPVSSVDRDRNYNICITMAVLDNYGKIYWGKTISRRNKHGVFKKRLNFCYKNFIAHFTAFLALSPSKKSPLLAIHRSQRFYHCWNASWNALSVMARSYLVAFSWISSMVSKRRPFKAVLSLGNRKKCAGAKPGE